MRRVVTVLVLLTVLGWVLTKLFDPERWRTRARQSLELALGRRVEINGPIAYEWLTGPALAIDDVVIHEDPRLGQEPLAYVTTLEATPKWLALVRGDVEFSSLLLVEPSLNVMRAESGELNVQPFLEGLYRARSAGGDLPEIKVRGGRLNFKQGARKAVAYLAETDLDLRPNGTGGFYLRLATAAARTDRPPGAYGSFSASGQLRLREQAEPEVDITLDLDRSSLSDVLILPLGRRVEISGRVSARTKLAGPLSQVKVDGRLDLEGFQRWSLPGLKPGALTIYYRGDADLVHQTIRLATVADPKTAFPVRARFRAEQAFSRPRWALIAGVEELPLAAAQDAARVLGLQLPEDLPVEGSAAGAVGVSGTRPQLEGGFLIEAAAEEQVEVLVSGGSTELRPRRRP